MLKEKSGWDWDRNVQKYESFSHDNQYLSYAAGAAVGVGVSYLAYRGIRMLPSLMPPLWGTIPANVVMP